MRRTGRLTCPCLMMAQIRNTCILVSDMLIRVIEKVKNHVQAATRFFRNRELIRDLRNTAISTFSLSEFEMAQLGNLWPSGVEEARSLIPSLTSRDENALQRLLDEMAVMRRFQ